MPVRRDGAAAAFLLALSTREGAFLLEKGSAYYSVHEWRWLPSDN